MEDGVVEFGHVPWGRLLLLGVGAAVLGCLAWGSWGAHTAVPWLCLAGSAGLTGAAAMQRRTRVRCDDGVLEITRERFVPLGRHVLRIPRDAIFAVRYRREVREESNSEGPPVDTDHFLLEARTATHGIVKLLHTLNFSFDNQLGRRIADKLGVAYEVFLDG